ncbi:MAG: WG repeat-containing protein [Prevotella sp.]|nr:WG repeat-containing protein [Prevotella sp.]
MENDDVNALKKETPKYRLLGESGLVEDEDGNFLDVSDLERHDRQSGTDEGEKVRFDEFIKTTFVSELDDKSNPAYWYFYYDPRYCGPSREAYANEMASRYRRSDSQEATEKVSDVSANPIDGSTSTAFQTAKEKADIQQREVEQLGLHPVFHLYDSGRVFYAVENKRKEVIISNEKYNFVSAFRCGLALARDRKTQRYGFVDRHGHEVVPCSWRSAEVFTEYMAGVMGDDRKCGYVDVSGRLAVPCVWDNGWPFHNGLARVQKDGRIGMIDHRGQLAIPCIWKGMGDFSEGLAGVQDDKGKCGFVDRTGKVVIQCRWKNVWIFHEGLAVVQDFNKRLGFIDKTGTLVIPCQWKKVNFFQNGIAKVSKSKSFLFRDKWVYIDKQGREV